LALDHRFVLRNSALVNAPSKIILQRQLSNRGVRDLTYTADTAGATPADPKPRKSPPRAVSSKSQFDQGEIEVLGLLGDRPIALDAGKRHHRLKA
jgi:hypothetical protein